MRINIFFNKITYIVFIYFIKILIFLINKLIILIFMLTYLILSTIIILTVVNIK